MRVFIISGSKNILNEIKNEMSIDNMSIVDTRKDFMSNDNTIYFSDDYSVITEIYEKNMVSFIVAIHDKENPVMDAKKGYFFNEFRETRPVEFESDLFLMANESGKMDIIEKEIENYQTAEAALKKIESGQYSIRFKEFLFGAGHESDCHIFEVFHEQSIGTVSIAKSENEIDLNIDGINFANYGWIRRTNLPFYEYAEKIILDAYQRDDQLFAETIGLPVDFCDISRNQAIAIA